ncbi:MAG: HTH domain-containing protein [Opitutales bacterium]|nr:HTH domain-containing protein [Opitutales bacterium]
MPREGPSMLRRLITISDQLKANRSCSCASLAERLEVHSRTIRRDIDFLRDECGAPIAWEPSTKTWFLDGHWEGFGSLRLDSAESLALILAEQSFRRVRHTPIATALHAILEKIAQSAGENLRHSWESLARTVHPTGQTTAELREHVTVLAPKDLITAFATIAEDFSKKYPKTKGGGHSLSGVR